MAGKIAMVFVGQGSQYPKMCADIRAEYKAAQSVYAVADRVIGGVTHMTDNGTKQELSQTINAQPCLMSASLAVAYALKECGLNVDVVAGFSLGEITALVYSGVVSLEQGMELTKKRAGLMQQCAESSNGAMAAVLGSLSHAQIESIIEESGAYAVNYNCPGQIVAAGSSQSIQTLVANAPKHKLRAIKLAVNGAFHSPYMDRAAEKIKAYLDNIPLNNPTMDVYSNYTAKKYHGDFATLIATQINHPVKWQSQVEQMIEDGVDIFVEVGPGRVLSGLIQKINGTVAVHNVENMDGFKEILNALCK